MQTASDIIQMFGGPAVLSKEAGIPLTTVVGWRHANFIPEWRQPALIALGKKQKCKVALGHGDFPPPDARVAVKDRASVNPRKAARKASPERRTGKAA